MKYFTKPTTVEAFQVESIFSLDYLPAWAKELKDKGYIDELYTKNCLQIFNPPTGEFLKAYEGDYVIMGWKGNIDVCTESFFKFIFSEEENQ